MSVRIRLQRRGRKQRPLYHIIIADSRSPRDGKFIEKIGVYNPLSKPALIEIDRDRAFDWLMKGAEPTDTVRAILRFKGVMYRKHLSRGVSKGAMTQEEADAKYAAWVAEKEAHIENRRKASTDEIAAYHAKRSGTAKPAKPKAEEPVADEAVTEQTAVEETPAAAEEATATEAPAAVEETPAAPEASPTEESAEEPAASENAQESSEAAETTESADDTSKDQ